jgi:hypothetical protein
MEEEPNVSLIEPTAAEIDAAALACSLENPDSCEMCSG